jgi:uncharacterized membrane protein
MIPVLLFLHVAIAGVALAAGALGLFSRKGGSLHRKAGLVFVATMLAMTAIAFALAVPRHDLVSIVPSMLTFYLVATGWRTFASTCRRPADLLLLALAIAAAATGYALGLQAAHGLGGQDDKGFPATVYYVFASIALFAGLLDIERLMRGLATGPRRLARHAWRMSLAMLIATTSFFQGQERVFPAGLHGSLLLKLPALAVIAVAVYWLLRLSVAQARIALRRKQTVTA